MPLCIQAFRQIQIEGTDGIAVRGKNGLVLSDLRGKLTADLELLLLDETCQFLLAGLQIEDFAAVFDLEDDVHVVFAGAFQFGQAFGQG